MSEILSMSHVCNNKNNVSNISMKNQPGQMRFFSLCFTFIPYYTRLQKNSLSFI